jgi:fucose permease
LNNTSSTDQSEAWYRDQLIWLTLALGVFLGLVVCFLPPLFTAMSETYTASFEELGRTQFVFFISGIVYSLSGGWLTAHIGLRGAARLSSLSVALGMVCIALGNSLLSVFIGTVLNGIGSCGLAVTASAIIARCYPDQRQKIFIYFGIAASLGFGAGPAFLGWWLEWTSASQVQWHFGVYLYAVLFALLGLWAHVLRTPHTGYDERGHEDGRRSRDVMMEVFRSPVLHIASAWFFLHGLAQIGISSWIGIYGRDRLGIGVGQAAWFLTANAVGFLLGRLLLTWLTHRYRIHELKVLAISSALAAIMFVLTLLAPTYGYAMVFFTLAGLFISGDAPSVQSYFGMRFAGQSATAFALLGGIGNIGAASGPYVIGIIGTFSSIEAGIWAMPVFMVILSVSAVLWYFLRERRSKDVIRAESAVSLDIVETVQEISP